MSRGFKLTISTIALLLSFGMTMSAGFGCGLASSHSFSCLLGTTVGPLTLIFYIIFFITNSNISFGLSLLPFLYFILYSVGILK